MLVGYKCNIATEKAVAFLVVILYLVGGLGETYPHTSRQGCGYKIYIIVLPAPAGGGRTNPTGGKTTHPTNQQVWRGRTDSPGGADR